MPLKFASNGLAAVEASWNLPFLQKGNKWKVTFIEFSRRTQRFNSMCFICVVGMMYGEKLCALYY